MSGLSRVYAAFGKEPDKAALRIAGFYGAVASMWILLSDLPFFDFFGDIIQYELYQLLKGIGFVLVTALLLFLFLRREFRRRDQIADERLSLQRRIEIVYESVQEAVFVADAKSGAVLEMNSAARRMCALSDIGKRTIYDLVRIGDSPGRTLTSSGDAAGNLQEAELFCHAGGQLRGEASLSFVEWEGQRLLLVVFRDLSERWRNLERIEEQASLLDAARDAIIVCDFEGTIRSWNEAAAEIYGWGSEEAVGRNWQAVFVPAPGSIALHDIKAALVETGSWQGELSLSTRSGEMLTLESRFTISRGSKGEPRAILVIQTDVTERKRLEEKMEQAQKLGLIGRCASGVAHDFNNILSVILGYSEICRQRLGSERPRELQCLEQIIKATDRGARIVSQILQLGKESLPRIEQIDLYRQMADLEELLRSVLPKSIAVSTALDEDLPPIEGDATQINRVLMNLCLNSRDAMPKGGRVRVAVRNWRRALQLRASTPPHDTEWVCFEVIDSGSGISKEERARIGQPFFSTKGRKGTGLGLSIVSEIVRAHGGTIAIRSRENEGTTVQVLLPALAPSRRVERTGYAHSRHNGDDDADRN